MSQGMYTDTMIRLEALKRIFVFCPKIEFFSERKVEEFLVKNDQIL